MNFEIAINQYMENCKVRQLRKSTMASYEQTLRLFAKYALDEHKITDANKIKTTHINKYIEHLQERGKYTYFSSGEAQYQDRRRDCGKKISPSCINSYIRNLKAFFSWLYDDDKHPMSNVKQLKFNRTPKGFLDDDEFMKLINCLDKSKFSEYRDARY